MVYNKRVVLLLPNELYEKIEKKSKELGLSRNEIIRISLVSYLSKRGEGDG